MDVIEYDVWVCFLPFGTEFGVCAVLNEAIDGLCTLLKQIAITERIRLQRKDKLIIESSGCEPSEKKISAKQEQRLDFLVAIIKRSSLNES